MIPRVVAHRCSGRLFAAPSLPHRLGDEIDLVLVRGGRPVIAVDMKRSTAPVVGAGFYRAVANLGVERAYVVHPDTGREP